MFGVSSGVYGYIAPGADTVTPFNNIKTGPCDYILIIGSTTQVTRSFTLANSGTIYYDYFAESEYGAYTTITKNGTIAKTGTQGTTITDNQNGNFIASKNDVISVTGYLGSANTYRNCYFLIIYCIYS